MKCYRKMKKKTFKITKKNNTLISASCNHKKAEHRRAPKGIVVDSDLQLLKIYHHHNYTVLRPFYMLACVGRFSEN